MTSQTTKVVLSLDAEEVSSLKEGVNFKKSPEDAKYYIIYKSTEGLRACKNQCKHQGGLFIKDIEDLDSRWETDMRDYVVYVVVVFIKTDRLLCSHRTVKCTKHNWKLNVSTMKYVNPPDSFLQDELSKFCQYPCRDFCFNNCKTRHKKWQLHTQISVNTLWLDDLLNAHYHYLEKRVVS